METTVHPNPDFRTTTLGALTLVASLRRLGMPMLQIPQALNDLGYKTPTHEAFNVAAVKQLLKGEIGAVR